MDYEKMAEIFHGEAEICKLFMWQIERGGYGDKGDLEARLAAFEWAEQKVRKEIENELRYFIPSKN